MSKNNDSNMFGWAPLFPISKSVSDKLLLEQLEERVKALEAKVNEQK